MKKENKTKDAVSCLNELKEKGYLFHGSSNSGITVLEPRYTFDPKSGENTDTAVFATNDITWPIIFGLHGGHKGWRTSVRVSDENETEVTAFIPKEHKENIEKAKGIIYVLPRDSFEEGTGGQFKSKVAVKPQAKVEVNFQDYLDAGGKIEWT